MKLFSSMGSNPPQRSLFQIRFSAYHSLCGIIAAIAFVVPLALKATGAVVEVAKLTAEDGRTNDNFGYAAAISGDTIFIGAPGKESSKGSVYLFSQDANNPGQWRLLKELSAGDAFANDRFGSSIAVSGETAVILAPGANSNAGAAHIFSRNQGGAGQWGLVAKFPAYGSHVAIEGDTIVVGAAWHFGDAGASIFQRNQGGTDQWGLVKQLQGPTHNLYYGFFGVSVAISGDTVAVGEAGSSSLAGYVYVYERNLGGANQWGLSRQMPVTSGFEDFGRAIAVDHDTLLVGSPGPYFPDPRGGMVYFFGRNQGGTEQWGKTAALPKTPSGKNDDYGGSVALSRDTALVGASAVYGTIPGAAHLFQRGVSETNSWTEIQVLVGSDAVRSDGFGASVATDGQTMIVGAPLHAASTGAAYVFMSAPQRPLIKTYALSANGFRLDGQGKPGFVYRIQASQDLVSWTGIGVSLADTNGFLSFTDSDAPTLASRAYRITEQ